MEYSHYEDELFTPGFIIACVVMMVFYMFCMWRIFTKAGRPGWEALIPIYNAYILLKIVGKPGWWLLLFLVPIVNIVFLIWTYNMLSKSFGKDEGFTIGLLLLGIIFFPILAFGGAKYLGPYGNAAEFQAYQGRNKFDFENPQHPGS